MLRWTPLSVLTLCVALALGFAVRDGALRADGPLRDLTSGGGSGLYAPRGAQHWHATFGDLILCAKEPDADITLTGVRMRTAVAPLAATVYLRRVGADSHGATPVGTIRGVPPSFRESAFAGSPGLAGAWTTHLAGVRITQTCSDVRSVRHGFTELVLTLDVGHRGGQVNELWVDYRTHGRMASARANWRFVACGSATHEPDLCTPPS